MTGSMPFIDLQAQRRAIGRRLDDAISRVLDHGAFILGPEVSELEGKLASFVHAQHAVACANGTDALQLALMAWGVGPGDAVFTPSFTFASTAEVVGLVGAEPVMVDILPDTFNMDPDDLARAIEMVKSEGRLNPRVVIAVDLFGQAADYPAISRLAREYGLRLIADSAQGYGCTIDSRHPLAWADVATTSFYPAKPLGCYGDGGAVFTNDDTFATLLRSYRIHGAGTENYDNVRIGLNSRLDTIQAAILIEKLAVFTEEIERRNEIAARYNAGLHNAVETPFVKDGYRSVWAQYTIKTDNRAELAAHLKDRGVPTAIYYPKPLHRQTAYKGFQISPGGLPVSDDLSQRVLSLPMHPYLSKSDQDRIISAVADFQK